MESVRWFRVLFKGLMRENLSEKGCFIAPGVQQLSKAKPDIMCTHFTLAHGETPTSRRFVPETPRGLG